MFFLLLFFIKDQFCSLLACFFLYQKSVLFKFSVAIFLIFIENHLLLVFSVAEFTRPLDTMIPLQVRHTGEVKWNSPSMRHVSCPIRVKFFPYDRQKCKLGKKENNFICNGVDFHKPKRLLIQFHDFASEKYQKNHLA